MHAARLRSLHVVSTAHRASQPSAQHRSRPVLPAHHSERMQVMRAPQLIAFLRRLSTSHQHGPACAHHSFQSNEPRQSSASNTAMNHKSSIDTASSTSGPKAGALTAERYVEKMERAGLPVTADALSEFIAHACAQRDLSRAMSFFRLLKSRSLAPGKRTVAALVQVMQLAVAHTSADAKEVLAYLQNPPAQPNAPPKASDFDFNAPEFAQLQLLVGGPKPLDDAPEFGNEEEDIHRARNKEQPPPPEKPNSTSGGGGRNRDRMTATEETSESVGPFGVPWFLWLFPVIAFLLGTWQVYRWDRKQKLKQEREARLKSPAQPLPGDMSNFDLAANAYKPFITTGKLDNASFAFVAPRMYDGELGKWLVSAFEENGTGRRILLNRGWLPHADQAPVVEGEVTITGRVRGDGARNSFTPANDVAKGSFFSLDVHQLAEALHTEPVLLDVAKNLNAGSVPIPPPPGVLPDNHLQYVGTWYTLSAALTAMALRYGKKTR